jgi:hypothetical protein
MVDSQVQPGEIKFADRTRAYRLSVGLYFIAAVFIFLYELAPLIDKTATVEKALASSEFREARIAIKAPLLEGEQRVLDFDWNASALTEVAISFTITGGTAGATHVNATRVRIRPDVFILWVGVIFVFGAMFATVIPNLTRLRFGPVEVQFAGDVNKEASENTLTSTEQFASEVASAAHRADAFYARSTLLLVAGIAMAFVGVGIFYVTLPETQGEQTLLSYGPKLIRPTGVLIFVEAISWFLLRQYRALVEDYKWFYRLYLKRANYLAALRILGSSTVRPEDVYVAVALIQEDLSGRLKSGETTEAIEALKAPEESPISEILRTLSAIKHKAVPE